MNPFAEAYAAFHAAVTRFQSQMAMELAQDLLRKYLRKANEALTTDQQSLSLEDRAALNARGRAFLDASKDLVDFFHDMGVKLEGA